MLVSLPHNRNEEDDMTLEQELIPRIAGFIVEETGLKPFQVENTVELLREGATVPFIARYRKERTGELDEVQIRQVEERFTYFSELEQRRITILSSVEEQGKLTLELRSRIEATRQRTCRTRRRHSKGRGTSSPSGSPMTLMLAPWSGGVPGRGGSSARGWRRRRKTPSPSSRCTTIIRNR